MDSLISRKSVLNKIEEWSNKLNCENSEQFSLAEFEHMISAEPSVIDEIETIEEAKRMVRYANLAKKHSTIGRVIEECAEYEEIGTVEEVKTKYSESDKNIDYFCKIGMYLVGKYRNELMNDFGIEKNNNEITEIMKIFNKIYEIEKEKYPLMWYEYGFGSP